MGYFSKSNRNARRDARRERRNPTRTVTTVKLPPTIVEPVRSVDIRRDAGGGKSVSVGGGTSYNDRVGSKKPVVIRIDDKGGGGSRNQPVLIEGGTVTRVVDDEAVKQAENYQSQVKKEAVFKSQQQKRLAPNKIYNLDNLPEQRRISPQETRTDLAPPNKNFNIQTKPYLQERFDIRKPTDIFSTVGTSSVDNRKSTDFPTKVVYIDPTGIGVQKERTATPDEKAYYKEIKAENFVAPTSTFGEKLGRWWRTSTPHYRLKNAMSIDFISDKNTNKLQKVIEVGIKKTPLGINLGDVSPKLKKAEDTQRKLVASTIVAVIPKTSGELLTDVATWGIGAGVGAGVRLTEKGVGTLAGRTALKFTGSESKALTASFNARKTFKVGTTIGGGIVGGFYTGAKVQEFKSAESPIEVGTIIGKTGKELYLFGKGYSFGERLGLKYIQYQKTRGFKEIEAPTRTSVLEGIEDFPTAGKGTPLEVAKTHKKLFEEGKFVERFKEPGKPSPGYHVTSQEFVPRAGRTPVTDPLHISTEASVHFSKISGEKGSTLPTWKQIFEPSPEPTTYVVTPQGYKINIGKEVKRGEYSWNKPTEPGVANIPGTKTEIQAVFEKGTEVVRTRPAEYYYKVDGTRLPVEPVEAVKMKDLPMSKRTPNKIIEFTKLTTSSGGTPSYSTINQGSFLGGLTSSGGSSFSGGGTKYSIPKPSSKVSSTGSSYSKLSSPSSSFISPSSPSYRPSSSPLIVKPSSRLSFSPSQPSSYSSKISRSYLSESTSRKPPMMFSLGAGFGFGGTKKVGGARKFSYAPSFKAMMFNIKSQKKTPEATKKWTGLETRGFTKGFSFFNVRKKKKKKKTTNNLKFFNFGN